ncbi:unnamed protein product [Lactuca saligna]|uniref:SWIM-type domain-containing protein n=1 Tax=Lactuca saligna TaxID=75948 RepID=A0AA35Z9H0_LACSI|nr:unnamed protein product [Lactuca saligna]
MWHLRLSSTSFDPRVVYDGHPTLFTIKLHHGGEFTKFPNVNYIEGTVTYVDMVDIEEFSIHEMDAIMKGLGYSVPPVIYYHFRVPKGDMHFGLRALGNDDDVLNLSQYVKEHKLIRVYTEHGITNLLTYFMAPKPVRKVIIEQLEEIDEHQTPPTNNQPSGMPQTCIPPVIANEAALALSISPEYNKKREFIKDKPLSSCIKKLVMDDVSVDRIGGNKDDADNEIDHGFNEFDEECNDINRDFNEFHEACNDINQGFNEFDEAANDFDIGLYQQILQSNEQNVDDEVHEGEENTVNKEVTEEENHDRNEMNDENVEMRDFAVDDGSEDNIEIDEDNTERSDESEDSDDSDFWVDEDNIIPDVEVDMRDFYMNIDLEAEFLEKRLPKHRENDSDEVNEELGVIDNDQWDSLDEGSDIDRKRRAVIKELGKETRCSQGEIHKGLQTAISQLFPCAEHSSYDVEAYNWLKQIPPQHWARSHFTGRAVSDMLLNNLCEVFNSKLIEGRDKPLISCLEYIREYMMKRICNVIKVQKKCVGPLTPSATKIMEKNVNWASQYTVRWNGSDKYQVQGPWQDQHVVDMVERVCSCRKWELTGLPCKHVIAVLNDKADNGEEVGELHTYAHRVHWLETWKAAYVYKVEPIKGRAMWPISECPIKITPPIHKNQPGRPKKKRRHSAEEKSQKKGDNVASGSGSQSNIASRSGKLTRKFIQVTCSKCKIKGHNARTCKGQGGK